MNDCLASGGISGWIPAVLGLLILGCNWILSRLQANEGPAWGMRAVQAVLALLSVLMIYAVYLQLTG